VSGSLGTRELRVGELAIDITAKGFEVLRNQLGTMEVQTSDLAIRGPLEAPRISGNITVLNGELRVDDILSRALLQPYATEALDLPGLETIRALNIWDRLSMNILLHSLGGLRMTGDSVTVSSNAPLGLGSFDIRAAGDINVYKDPGEEVSVSGSLDSLTGTFAFQGRRFELYPSSSVDFQGDFKNPELFFTVFRVVSGVETRVTISGPLHSPELRLSSNPPLDPSDVLSLIVFNTTTNELSSAQQQELGVRAGALAVGFLASTLTGALERSLGIDILEIEPTAGVDAGAKVTVGQEIAPGLVARFSRHFGSLPYDEATLEYRISRMLSIRASFSDATAVGLRSPFRRVERAVVDLLFFFSF
jgi:autotransporter translocation and assembly factor TamB